MLIVLSLVLKICITYFPMTGTRLSKIVSKIVYPFLTDKFYFYISECYTFSFRYCGIENWNKNVKTKNFNSTRTNY
jgi:hypothetical protein